MGSAVDSFHYMECDWGDSITGTKEQLQALGIARDQPFPGEVGAHLRCMTTLDPRGFRTSVRREPDGRYVASIWFRGRELPEEPVARPFAPGVTKLENRWSDAYTGTGLNLVAAGHCRLPAHLRRRLRGAPRD